MRLSIATLLLLLLSCNNKSQTLLPDWIPYNEGQQILENQSNENKRLQFELIQSRNLHKNEIWENLGTQLADFNEEMYRSLKPFIFEQDINTIQHHIENKEFTYKQLVQWFLYRIVLFENDSLKTLHTIIDINPNAVEQAEVCDLNIQKKGHPIFGMPILIKDNIDVEALPTTAGAVLLKDNIAPKDAFIINQIESKGGIILGKLNLSEWAYFFCDSCPLGYSAIGGQTLNPYGPRVFETGGSSAGSGTAMAASYAVAAIGTETSGSILSPSSQNSVVGFKPTIGLLSRSGIVPISSTLDTPGPMTRNVDDNLILMSAMIASDANDPKTFDYTLDIEQLRDGSQPINNFKLIFMESLYSSDSLYRSVIEKIKSNSDMIKGAYFEAKSLSGFLTLLNLDMRHDLPQYLLSSGFEEDKTTIEAIIDYNLQDTFKRMPYGQGRFDGIIQDTFPTDSLSSLKSRLKQGGRSFFAQADESIENWDAIISINNYHASYAAVAEYPAITMPLGYKDNGEPINITFIGKAKTENLLYQLALAFEKMHNARKFPNMYN